MNAPETPTAGTYIGQRVPRKEDTRLLTGRGTYVDDVGLPGMLQVAFHRSPIARGRIKSMDLSVARQLPGVHAVLTAEDLKGFKVDMLSFFLAPPVVPVPVLATDRVTYVGDPIAMVIAQDRYIAEDAAGLITVEYDEEDPVVTIRDAKTGSLVHPDTDSNVAAATGSEEIDEDLEAQLKAAPHLVTIEFDHQRISQSPMETRGVVVAPQGSGELTIYLSCQGPQLNARWFAQAFGMPQTAIRVISKDVGGSFGLKGQPWREEVATVLAAMLLKRPLKWIEDRLENLTAANQAREQEIRLRAAFDGEGHMLASHADYGLNNGAYPQGADSNIAVMMFLWGAHKMPVFSFHSRGWFTNTVGLSAYRGPWAIESLAREVLLDRAARQMGMDAIELRRRNLIRRSDQPCTTPMGLELEDISPAECLDVLLQKVDVAAFRVEQAEARKQGRYLGLGFATYIEPTAGSTGVAVLMSESAHIRIEPTGTVTAVVSTHSQGHGTQTTMAQVIAERLGVRFDDVSVYEDDSSRGGYGSGAYGSRQAVAGGGACIRAADLLLEKVRLAASHLLGVKPEQIMLREGVIHVLDGNEKTVSLRDLADIAYGDPDRLPAGMDAGLEVQYRYRPPPITMTSAAHACIVEVDAETGFVKIKRWVTSEDCGVMINPSVVEGQIAGGLAQAIGSVLMEEVSFDARGNPTAVTYKDYMLPTIFDIPDFEYHHEASQPSKAEGGFRGVGEGGCIVGPPTLVNAIADALAPFGELKLEFPLTPSRLLGHIEGRPIAEKSAPPPTIVAAPVHKLPTSPAPQEKIASNAAVQIDGNWKFVLSTPMGPQAFAGRMSTDGNALTGVFIMNMDEAHFTGTVTGNHLKWDLRVTKPMSITLKYEATIEGDKLIGKCKMGIFGTAKLTGERQPA
ncbi:xanthine dehydrogenase family protein molybdopterin-binding subunit [Solimonas sp. K1W22B-7]|uniref:xanthine dehydrogenase family protein molybdopterin-binding subunit n=1 Tax=Solimonas sp. K1W22B-7 TaxID=2303331 RepID=UPI000E331A48|nr:xanthine dehydrogenase family protein molybdopterin-binding subunit [Solimonas sp. K1W22B-7]AXQ28531.1 xanthine dehydrogenase family protein molybdopterin-binding subunit [Solimonas sp. K1W22B-7]